MWPWIYRLISVLLAVIGAALMAALEQAWRMIGRDAGVLVVRGAEPLALAAGVGALLLFASAALIPAGPAGRPGGRG